MRAGTALGPRTDTLADAIDAALRAEWSAAKGEPLPAAGAEDRRILCAAIAQGIVDWLKERQGDFIVSLTGTIPANLGVSFALDAPALTVSRSGSSVTATASGFTGAVALHWDDPSRDVATIPAG